MSRKMEGRAVLEKASITIQTLSIPFFNNNKSLLTLLLVVCFWIYHLGQGKKKERKQISGTTSN